MLFLETINPGTPAGSQVFTHRSDAGMIHEAPATIFGQHTSGAPGFFSQYPNRQQSVFGQTSFAPLPCQAPFQQGTGQHGMSQPAPMETGSQPPHSSGRRVQDLERAMLEQMTLSGPSRNNNHPQTMQYPQSQPFLPEESANRYSGYSTQGQGSGSQNRHSSHQNVPLSDSNAQNNTFSSAAGTNQNHHSHQRPSRPRSDQYRPRNSEVIIMISFFSS